MGKATKDHLLKGGRGRGTDTVTLSDGMTVTVRALSRNEALGVQDLATTQEKDDFIISKGMTDPQLTPAEVSEWGAAAPAGDLQAVSRRIAELSGMLPDSGKEAYKSAGR
ncbi:MAG TPA: hypothetical protein VD864_13855 [Nocardioides sp.]|nr:hypothetical protein [Nocardioides sp.]